MTDLCPFPSSSCPFAFGCTHTDRLRCWQCLAWTHRGATRNAVRGGFMRSAWPEDLLGPDLDDRIWAEVTAESFNKLTAESFNKFVVASASKSCVNFKSISRSTWPWLPQRRRAVEEPLVQPCRCRGSMGGVHASCVEAWVEYHRRSTFQGAEAPCCPVCRYPYGGRNMAPGPKVLFRHLTRCFGQQLLLTLSEALRFAILGTLLVHFCRRPTVASPLETNDWRHWLRRPAAEPPELHTLAVLLISLPPHRAPPHRRMLQRLFTSDTWRLARHVAELLATVLLLGCRCFYGDLPFACFLPVGLLAILPICQLALWYRPTDWCREGALMSAPLLLALELGQLAWQCRYRFFNVRDGPMHLLIALIACPLALLRSSLKPALMLFMAHSAAGALASRDWRPGNTWFYAVMEAFSLAVEQKWITLLLLLLALRALQRAAVDPPPPMPRNGIGSLLLQGPMWWCSLLVIGEASGLLLRELGPVRDGARQVSVASLAWLVLLLLLACSVNWSRCCSDYRRWQRRNTTFVLALEREQGTEVFFSIQNSFFAIRFVRGPLNGSASTTFLDSPRLAGCRQTWHGALVVRKDETPWRNPPNPLVSVADVSGEPAADQVAPAALVPLALSTPRAQDLAAPAALPMDFASMESIVTSSHMSPKVKATWQLETPLPSDGHDRTQSGKSRGYKSAMDLLQSKQLGSQGLAGCDRSQAGKSRGYKSALDLLRPKQIVSQGPTAERILGAESQGMQGYCSEFP
eukprot:s2668_g1.t2